MLDLVKCKAMGRTCFETYTGSSAGSAASLFSTSANDRRDALACIAPIFWQLSSDKLGFTGADLSDGRDSHCKTVYHLRFGQT